MTNNKIVILTPTPAELGDFAPPPGVEVVVCGVGSAAAGASTACAIARYRPRLLILAGIAGAVEGGGLQPGDVVAARSERIADLGAIREGNRFEELFGVTYECPYMEMVPELRAVDSRTVSTAASGMVRGGEIENMEGAAFFAVAGKMEVQFLEIRAISNFVGEPPAMWKVAEAAANLSAALTSIITHLPR